MNRLKKYVGRFKQLFSYHVLLPLAIVAFFTFIGFVLDYEINRLSHFPYLDYDPLLTKIGFAVGVVVAVIVIALIVLGNRKSR